jgi:ABC-type oligopeptide transport system ATPase subunit
MSDTEPLLSVAHLTRRFPLPGPWLGRRHMTAVSDVSFSTGEGEIFGLIGESGSGKSTIGRMIARLIEPSSGSIRFQGRDWLAHRGRALRKARRSVQMVFQSPYASLDPRWRIGDIIAEPLRTHEPRLAPHALRERVCRLMTAVGLDPSMLHRYPHQFSGGQRQRIAIARAIAPGPDLLIADEPVSALDVSIQAQILELLQSIRASSNCAMLFISHDLSVVSYLCHRVGVLQRGELVETAPTQELFSNPRHPYTRALMAAVPRVDY